MEKTKMREEYDFSNAVKNPYVGKLKQQITIRLDEQVIEYHVEHTHQNVEQTRYFDITCTA